MIVVGVVLLAAVAAADPGADRLRDLRPLPKPHYSWPLPGSMLTPDSAVLREYTRITHAVSVRGESVTAPQIAAAVVACKAANAAGPSVPATIAINYSPWHRRFPRDRPPTDVGSAATAEVDAYRAALERIRGSLADANREHAADVRVSALLLDCERFRISDDEEWNAAMTRKHDAIADVSREVFPDARVEWYARGGFSTAGDATWRRSPYFTLRERGDSFSCALYGGPRLDEMREAYRRTRAEATAHAVSSVTPWIALGAGYAPDGSRRRWSFDWPYDQAASARLGAEVNGGAAPWDTVRVVVFYPSPFDDRMPRGPQHFVAYVEGATGASN